MADPDAFHVIGIGASAGGLEALERFFDHVPSDSGLAYVVVQHLSPDHRSMMVELLSKHTMMPVVRIEDGMQPTPDTVYLLPPRHAVSLEGGRLRLTEKGNTSALNLPIDQFFQSLAEDMADRAVAIVLSGTGSDGMRGVRAVKEHGGLVMVQDEKSARFDGMPRAAISTGLVDYVLPPEEMPERLLSYVRYVGMSRQGTAMPPAAEDHLVGILAVLRRQTGVDFTYYKPTTIHRRIERRMNINQVTSLDEYLRILRHSPREVGILYKELLIGVTKFFRDQEAWEVIERQVVPQLLQNATDGQVRVWVAGCATGEEAYSLAILLREALDKEDRLVDVKIFATDLDREAIEFAGVGLYPDSIVADVSTERLQRYFLRKGDAWQVARPIRQMVIFASHDVTKDPPFTKIDLVSCRNLLIYLEPVLQRKVLSLFHFALKPGGFLLLGSSETIGEFGDRLRAVDQRHKVFRAGEGPRPGIAESLSLGPPRDSRRQLERSSHSEEARAIEQAWSQLVTEYAPPALLVDEYGELVHVFGDASVFLRIPTGGASLNVLRLLPRGLSAILGAAMQKVLREQRRTEYQNVRVKGMDGADALTVQVRPLAEIRGGRRFVLVVIDQPPQPAERPQSEVVDVGEAEADSFATLQQELQYTRENLQATIEELETSNEELQATNEELLASNEELQSTNEELQSVNEELYTVNAEYQSKIQELTDLNQDMDNLLRSTHVGTLFLDENLLIRKFTPAVTAIVNVMPRDLGRPIEHISTNTDDDRLVDDLRRVLATKEPVERPLATRDGRRFLLRVLPYMAGDIVGNGVVATFVDVTATEAARDRLQRVIDSLPQQIAVVGVDAKVLLANAAWQRTATADGLLASLAPGADYVALWRKAPPPLRDYADAVTDGIRAVLSRERALFTLDVPVSSGAWQQIQAAPIEGDVEGAVITHSSVTVLRAAQEALAEATGEPVAYEREPGA